MNSRTVYILTSFSALFWGANFVLAPAVLTDLAPLWAAALRFVIGAAVMIALSASRGDALLAPARRHPWVYTMLGTVGIGAFNLLFFFAMQRTSPANAALIMATNPLLTTLIAAFMLGERVPPRQLAALPLALLGVAIVISGGDLSRLYSLHLSSGDALMLGADLAWAFYNVLTRRYLPAGSAVANSTLVMVAGAVLLVIAATVSGETLTVPGMKAGMALLGMSLGGSVLAYLFWTTGISQLGAAKTSLFLNLVPVFAMLIEVVAGVLPGHAQLLGGAVVIGAVSLATLPRRQLATAQAT